MWLISKSAAIYQHGRLCDMFVERFHMNKHQELLFFKKKLWNSTNAPRDVGIFKVNSRAKSLCIPRSTSGDIYCFIKPPTYISCILFLLTKHVQWIIVWKYCQEESSTMWWHGLCVNLKKTKKMLMQTMSNSEYILQLIRLD